MALAPGHVRLVASVRRETKKAIALKALNEERTLSSVVQEILDDYIKSQKSKENSNS